MYLYIAHSLFIVLCEVSVTSKGPDKKDFWFDWLKVTQPLVRTWMECCDA